MRYTRSSYKAWLRPGTTVPLGMGLLLVLSSFLPWIKDPLGAAYNAWALPLEFGWWTGLPTSFTHLLTYGLLCLLCALYLLLVGYANVRHFRGSSYFLHRYGIAAVVCAVPILLFCVQYLLVDMPFMERLAQREVQLLLIQRHFGYRSAAQRIVIDPLNFDIVSFQQRFILLFDQVSYGFVGPCLSCWILIEYCRRYAWLESRGETRGEPRRQRMSFPSWPLLIGMSVLLLGIGRAPLGMFCESQAEGALMAGNDVPALHWLDAAQWFNPLLSDTAFFHRNRGQALYFLNNDNEQDDDVHIYLAASYRNQGNLFDAYQQLLPLWKMNHGKVWENDDLVLTLEMLVESKKPLKVQPEVTLDSEEAALQWLEILNEIDATNVYSRYSTGRINYELQNYGGCVVQMQHVLTMTSNQEVESSLYTYIGMSEEGLGAYALSRNLLWEAVALDPDYRNNVAREELSGLR